MVLDCLHEVFVYIPVCRPMFIFVKSFIQLDINVNEP